MFRKSKFGFIGLAAQLVVLSVRKWFDRPETFLPGGIVKYVNPIFLNDFGLFTQAGYNPALVKPVSVLPGQAIIVVGGYLGDSTQFYVDAYPKSLVHVFEPISSWCTFLEERFRNCNVRVYNFAASSNDTPLIMGVAEDETGVHHKSHMSVSVPSTDFAKFMDEIECEIGLVEINIEGAEYSLINHFLERSNNLPLIILVQFHKTIDNSDFHRELTRVQLEKAGYQLVYSFDWIWERWDLVKNRLQVW